MQLVPEYTNPVGACTACRASRRPGDRIVDLGPQVELLAPGAELGTEWRILDGDFQVCESCIQEMAGLVGMAAADLVAETNANMAELKAELTEVLDRAVAAELALSALRKFDAAKATRVDL